MIWKAIGKSVEGTSHSALQKGCEDSIEYNVIKNLSGVEVLVCCASDGAGSAQFAAFASEYITGKVVEAITDLVSSGSQVSESDIFGIAESIYEYFKQEAAAREVEINEFSCTLLGCCVERERAVFFQVGDGAIVRNDGLGFYVPVWWPFNGEYQNTTSFLVDDVTLKNLNIVILDEQVDEVALFTDGLQMLALNMEYENVHQPFFIDMFRVVRLADENSKIELLNGKLADYLNSNQINDRTDDDKTLFLASRLDA